MNAPQPAPRPPQRADAPTRRLVLQAAGITGIVAAAAACAPAVTATSSTPASVPAPAATSAPAPAPDTPAPTASGSAGTGASTGADLGPSAAVPEGGGTIYPAQKVVVTQPVPGVFKGFSAVCPHQGCLVSTVADGRIDCPCHGSQFSVFDGSRVAGPAPTGLSYADVTVSGADLFLNT
jgi:Rieske Fe-S protein